MKKFINEFKEFAMRGNVADMAVGVIIGGAFGKIVTSLVEDIIMPLLSVMLGTISFADLSAKISPFNRTGDIIEIKYGMFLQNVVDFLIIAFCIFVAVKIINRYKDKPIDEIEKIPAEPPVTREEMLLEEIRDLLKAR